MSRVLALMPPSSLVPRLLYNLRYLGRTGVGKVRCGAEACLGTSHLLRVSSHVPMGYILLSTPFQYGGKEVLARAIPTVLERHSAAQVSGGAEGAPGRAGFGEKPAGKRGLCPGCVFLCAPGSLGTAEYLTRFFFCCSWDRRVNEGKKNQTTTISREALGKVWRG